MPNIKSAKKRVLINAKKNLENRVARSKMNSAIKKFNACLDTNSIEEAEKLLPETMAIIDSTASMGIIHKNTAANKKSGIAKRLSDIKSGKVVVTIKKDNKTIAAEKAKVAQEARDAARAEFAKKAAEKQAAKLEAEKAKAAEKKGVKKADKKEEKPAKEEKKAVKKAEKKEEPAAEAKAEKKPAAKKPAKKDAE